MMNASLPNGISTPDAIGRPRREVPRDLKLALGTTLAVTGGAVVVLSIIFGWTGLPRPWSISIGLAAGLSAGAGSALVVCGLVGHRRTNSSL
jgi:hypothetical protein